MAPFLSEIVAAHRHLAARDDRDPDALVASAQAAALRAPRSPFAEALRAHEGLAVVAEVKRRSPSKGPLAADLDPADVAGAYASGGAACLSVLTDEEFFGGSRADLVAAKTAANLPVLRKDFTVSVADVCDTRLMGADAVLLIVAALGDGELVALHALAGSLGLDALVEVHDERELDRALDAGASLVGVNQRDLATFEVDPARAARLAARLPSEVVAVAESGIRGPDDARRLADAGYDAVLVGETVVTAPDRAAAVRALRGHRVAARAAHLHAAH
ncbi:MAG TPA: indole-3-glycerol phosphate synthase TrpC [Acidimicrobiales bacterium]|nr:indole-3-glycerol phosphate synthase TrpC [Acidimicrobiales bacterium]